MSVLSTTAPYEIRSATAADMAAVSRIYGYYVEETSISFEDVAPDAAEMLRRFEAVKAAALPYLVVVERATDTILGYAYAVPYRPRAAYQNTVEESVYVAHGQGGKGFGSLLLNALIEQCQALGKKQMISVITQNDQAAASIAVHKKLGFVQVGQLIKVGYKNGKWLNTLFYQRAL